MAGETPGANRASRRRLPWNEDKSTDKIYRSGNVSAINKKVIADSVLKAGQKPKPIVTPKQSVDDKNADKYYANGGSDRVRFNKKAAKRNTAAKAKPLVDLFIDSPDGVIPVLEAAAEKASAGAQVVVTVKQGDSALLRRTRTALELMVTREALTEAAYHSIRLAYALPPKAEPVRGEAANAVLIDEAVDPAAKDELEAILSADVIEQEKLVDALPPEPEVVPEPKAEPAAEPEASPAAVEDDTDLGDLVDQTEAAPETPAEVAEAPPEPVAGTEVPDETPAEAPAHGPRRQSRRGGRGSN